MRLLVEQGKRAQWLASTVNETAVAAPVARPLSALAKLDLYPILYFGRLQGLNLRAV